MRVFFKPNGLTIENGHVVINDIRTKFNVEGGTPFIEAALDTPISPEIKRRVVRVTYQQRIDDPNHIAILKTGLYQFGDFCCGVHKVLNDGRWIVNVSAYASSVQELMQFLPGVLAAEDEPTHPFTQAD